MQPNALNDSSGGKERVVNLFSYTENCSIAVFSTHTFTHTLTNKNMQFLCLNFTNNKKKVKESPSL